MAGRDIDEFRARVERVNQAREAVPLRRPPSRKAEIVESVAYPVSLGAAFLIGALAMGAASVVHYRLIAGGGTGALAGSDLLIAAGIGMTLSVIPALLVRLSSFAHLAMQGLGIFATVCTMHNLFHWLPAPMAAAFSPEHVAMVRASTTANSLIVLGRHVVVPADGAVPAEAPTVGFGEQGDVASGGARRIVVTAED